MMTFNEWLNDQKYRDDIVGDLANDASQDTNWPEYESVDKYIEYIEELPLNYHGVLKVQIVNALEDAWAEYEEAT